MKNFLMPDDHVYWYTKPDAIVHCKHDIQADVAIIGGGMAGLSAAQAFQKKNKKVVILEQYYCGAGASGKSSGFITPNAELSLTNFIQKYNGEAAHNIWKNINAGVTFIKNNIEKYKITCDYISQDTLFMANNKKSMKLLH